MHEWIEFPLVADLDNERTSLWKQHNYGQVIDLAALEIDANLPERFHVESAIRPNNESKLRYEVGSAIKILGYPAGMNLNPGYPIWKQATVASEPILDTAGIHAFFVDSATREGMSGSPVYAVSEGVFFKEDGTGGVSDGRKFRFLGVYSGRIGVEPKLSRTENRKLADLFGEDLAEKVSRTVDNANGMHLGIVWKCSALEELLNNPSPGSYHLTPQK